MLNRPLTREDFMSAFCRKRVMYLRLLLQKATGSDQITIKNVAAFMRYSLNVLNAAHMHQGLSSLELAVAYMRTMREKPRLAVWRSHEIFEACMWARHERYLYDMHAYEKWWYSKRSDATAVRRIVAQRAALTCVPQSRKVLVGLTREQRDQHRSRKAFEVTESERRKAWKELPKAAREAIIRDRRAAKAQTAEFQAGAFTKIVGTAACAAVAHTFGRLAGVLKSVKRTADTFADVARSIEEPAKQVRSSIVSFMAKAGKHIGVFVDVLVAMMLYYLVSKLPISTPLKTFVFGSLAIKLLSKHINNEVIRAFHKDEDVGVELQSGGKSFGTLLASLFAISAFRERNPNWRLPIFLTRLGTMEKVSGGWESFMDWCMNAMEFCINTLRKMLGKEKLDVFKRGRDPLINWFKKVDRLLLETITCKNDVGSDLVDELVTALRDGSAMKTFYYQTKIGREIDTYLGRLATALIPYQGSLNARNNFRIEPECAIFVGAPGIGKTMTTLFISAAVLMRSGLLPLTATPDVIKANIWQKGGGKFWNSYAGQHVMVMDDIWQAKGDPTDVDNEMMTIIRAVSPWSFPLEFADVASKGKNFFSSKFILATCNLSSIDNHARNFIHEPEAVARRIGHPYRMLLKKEYATADGRLDHVKYVAELEKCQAIGAGLNRFPWHIWEVARHNYITGETDKNTRPLLEVVDEIAERLAAKVRTHRDTEQTLDSFIGGIEPTQPVFQSGAKVAEGVESGFQAAFTTCADQVGSVYPEYQSGGRADVHQTIRVVDAELKRATLEYESMLGSLNPWVAKLMKVTTVGLGFGLGYLIWKELFKFFCHLIHGAFKAIKGFFAPRREYDEIQSEIFPQSNNPGMVVQRTPLPKLQSGTDVMVDKAFGNTYRIVVEGSMTSYGHLLMLNDRLGVIPLHFDGEIKSDMEKGKFTPQTRLMLMHCENPALTVGVPVSRFFTYRRYAMPEKELLFIVLADLRAHCNIEKNFITERGARYIFGQSVRLDTCAPDKDKIVRRTYSSPSSNILPYIDVADRRVTEVISYRASTKSGDCGAPLCLEDANNFSGGTVLGIHVAGNIKETLGFAALITREMIERARKCLDTIDDQMNEDLENRNIVLQSTSVAFYGEGKTFLPLGSVAKAVSLAPRSAYYKTPDYGIFGPFNKRPVPLSPIVIDGEKVFPLLKAVSVYGSPVYVYDATLLTIATHVAMKKFTALTSFGKVKHILSFDEAVAGVPEMKFRGIPRSTSAGFPYTYEHRNGKHDFFGYDGSYDLTTPAAMELRKRVEDIVEAAKLNVRKATIFVDFPKDELRPEEKAAAGQARPISSSPLDYVVAFRQYFGAFTAAFFTHHTHSGMAPGICPYTDWGLLAEKMQVHGSHVFDGDFKAFDSSEQPCVHEAILEYINSWYDDGVINQRVRKVLWADLCHSRHLGGDGTNQRFLYQWNKSLPSGHPLTTIVNSMYSLILLVATYMYITRDMTGFWEKVSAVTYGDDNVVNVAESVADVYNQESVSKAMAELFGVKYTSGHKDGLLYKTTTIDKITFLKRGFMKDDDGKWNGPLDLDSFLYTVYYCKNKRLEKVIRVDVLETAMQELALHSQDVWDTHAPIVYRALTRDGPAKAPLNRYAYREVIRAREDAWY